MRVKELENVEQLLNIKDNETYHWTIDYEITDCYKRIVDNEGCFDHIEHLYWLVKIFTERFLNDINNNLKLKYFLKEEIKTTELIARDIINYAREQKQFSGLIGSKCINDE